MVETDFGGDFVTIDSTEDGQIATIKGEGEYGELTFQGKTKTVLNIPVEIDGKEKTWTPGMKAGKMAQKAWGKDSKNWVGKQFEIVHIENKMLIRCLNTTAEEFVEEEAADAKAKANKEAEE